MTYSVNEKVFWVKQYNAGHSLREVCQLFEAAYPDRPKPTHTTIMRTIGRFEATGNVMYQRKGSHPKRKPSKYNLVVLAAHAANPEASARQIAQLAGISCSQVTRILRKNGYRLDKYPNKRTSNKPKDNRKPAGRGRGRGRGMTIGSSHTVTDTHLPNGNETNAVANECDSVVNGEAAGTFNAENDESNTLQTINDTSSSFVRTV